MRGLKDKGGALAAGRAMDYFNACRRLDVAAPGMGALRRRHWEGSAVQRAEEAVPAGKPMVLAIYGEDNCARAAHDSLSFYRAEES